LKIKFNNTSIEYELIDNGEVLYSTSDGGLKESAEFHFLTEELKLKDIKSLSDFALSYDNSGEISYVSLFDEGGNGLKRTIDANEIAELLHENSLSIDMVRGLDLEEDGNVFVSYTSSFSESPEYDTFKIETIQNLFKDMSEEEFKFNIVPYLGGEDLDNLINAVYKKDEFKENKNVLDSKSDRMIETSKELTKALQEHNRSLEIVPEDDFRAYQVIEVDEDKKLVTTGNEQEMREFIDEAKNINERVAKNRAELKTIPATDNMSEFYPTMSDEDKIKFLDTLPDLFYDRRRELGNDMSINNFLGNASYETLRGQVVGQTVFGVKDNLQPIEQYEVEIKSSADYLTYLADKPNDDLISYNYLKNERGHYLAYWDKSDSVGLVKRGVSRIDLDEDREKEFCFLVDENVVYLTSAENQELYNNLYGLELQWLESNTFETKELTPRESEEFEKWFNHHIGTEYEKNMNTKNTYSFTLFDIETDSELSQLKFLDISNLEEKSRVVMKLKNSDDVLTSNWMPDDKVEDFRIEASKILGVSNLDYRYDESEYAIYSKLDGTIPSQSADVKVITIDDLKDISLDMKIDEFKTLQEKGNNQNLLLSLSHDGLVHFAIDSGATVLADNVDFEVAKDFMDNRDEVQAINKDFNNLVADFYPLMNDKIKSSEKINHILDVAFSKRSSSLFKEFFLPSTKESRTLADKYLVEKSIFAYDGVNRPVGLTAFGIEDTLQPIDKYKELIKKTPLFQEVSKELGELKTSYIMDNYNSFTSSEIEDNSFAISNILRGDRRTVDIENALMNKLGFDGLRSKKEQNNIFRPQNKDWNYNADYNQKGTNLIGQQYFGVKDELKDVKDYVKDIVKSSEFQAFKDIVTNPLVENTSTKYVQNRDTEKKLKHLNQIADVLGMSVEDEEDNLTFNIYDDNAEHITSLSYDDAKEYFRSDLSKDTIMSRENRILRDTRDFIKDNGFSLVESNIEKKISRFDADDGSNNQVFLNYGNASLRMGSVDDGFIQATTDNYSTKKMINLVKDEFNINDDIKEVFESSLNQPENSKSRVVFQLVGDENIYVSSNNNSFADTCLDLDDITETFGNESFRFKQIESDINEPTSRVNAIPFDIHNVSSSLDDISKLKKMQTKLEENINKIPSFEKTLLASKEIELSYVELKIDSIENINSIDISALGLGDELIIVGDNSITDNRSIIYSDDEIIDSSVEEVDENHLNREIDEDDTSPKP